MKTKIEMISKFKNYLSLVKFSHTIFALPFAFIGFTLAINNYPERFSITKLILVTGCMITVRNAAMAFNRLVDKEIDKKNPRTINREIPQKLISTKNVKIFVITNIVIFILLTYFLNRLVFYLSPVAIAVVLGYSYTKRFTPLCHFILGVSLSLAPIGAYLAIAEKFDIVPLLFSISVIFWVSGFDIIYSLMDMEFDRKEKIYSIPAILGYNSSLFLSRLIHSFSILILLFTGIVSNMNYSYFIGLLIFCIIIFLQHFTIKIDKISKTFVLYNGTASIILSLFTILDILILKR